MIARHETTLDRVSIWAALSAPLADPTVEVIRSRLDEVVPGEWDFTLDLLPARHDEVAFKARMQILGVIREGVGEGKDYTGATRAAFVSAARAFRIGVAPAVPADRSVGGDRVQHVVESSSAAGDSAPNTPSRDPEYDAAKLSDLTGGESDARPPGQGPQCPKCGGKMWDNRRERDGSPKRNPKAPDFKCTDKACDGVIWPAKEGRTAQGRNVEKLAFPEQMPAQLRDIAGKRYVEVPTRRLTEAMDFVRLRAATNAHRQMVDDIAYVLEERRLRGDAGPAEGPPPSPGTHNRRGNLPDDPAEAAA